MGGRRAPPADQADAEPVARDSDGAQLADGDSVILIEDLTVKGAGQTPKRGLVVKASA